MLFENNVTQASDVDQKLLHLKKQMKDVEQYSTDMEDLRRTVGLLNALLLERPTFETISKL